MRDHRGGASMLARVIVGGLEVIRGFTSLTHSLHGPPVSDEHKSNSGHHFVELAAVRRLELLARERHAYRPRNPDKHGQRLSKPQAASPTPLHIVFYARSAVELRPCSKV